MLVWTYKKDQGKQTGKLRNCLNGDQEGKYQQDHKRRDRGCSEENRYTFTKLQIYEKTELPRSLMSRGSQLTDHDRSSWHQGLVNS